MMKFLIAFGALIAAPAMALTPQATNFTCGAGKITIMVFVDSRGDTTATTGFMGEAHQAPAKWTKNTLEWDVPASSNMFHFSMNSDTGELVIQPPASFGEALHDKTCRVGL